jgi:hypothetical protein
MMGGARGICFLQSSEAGGSIFEAVDLHSKVRGLTIQFISSNCKILI